MPFEISCRDSEIQSEIKPGDFVKLYITAGIYYVNRVYLRDDNLIYAEITKFANTSGKTEHTFLQKYENIMVQYLSKFVGTITIECT